MADITAPAPAPAVAETPRHRLPGSLDGWIAGLIGVGTIVFGLIWRSVPLPGDPWNYVRAAHDFPGQHWVPVGYARYGLILPLVALERVFSISQATEYTLPLIAGALCTSFVYLLMRTRYGRGAALSASALVLANSLITLTITRVYPDLPSTAVMVVAVYLAVRAGDLAQTRPESRRALLALLIGVGFCVGLSFEVRETVVFEWPIIAWVLLRRVGWRRAAVPVVLPALAWLGLEFVINAAAHGDALIRLRALTGADINGNGIAQDQAYLGHGRLHYLVLIPRMMNRTGDWRPMLAIGPIAIIGGVVWRRMVGLFATWFLLGLAALVVFGGVLHPAHPSIRQDIARYWIAFIVPMVMAAVATVAETGRWLLRLRQTGRLSLVVRRSIATVAALALLAWPVTAYAKWLVNNEQFAPAGGNAMEQLRGYLAARLPKPPQPLATVWGNNYTKRLLQFYSRGPFGGPRWHAYVRVLDVNAPPRPGDYVITVNHDTCVFCVSGMSKWQFGRSRLTADWQVAWQAPKGNVVVYRVT